MRIILTDQRETQPRSLEFSHAAVSVGADSSNILQLPSTGVPGFLAMLMPHHDSDHEKWSYIPIDQSVPAMLDGEPIRQQTVLSDGDEIRIDRFQMKFELTRPATAGSSEPGALKILQRVREHPLPPGSETHRPVEEIVLKPEAARGLARASLALSRCEDIPALIEAASDALLELLGARRVWVGLRRGPTGDLDFTGGKMRDGSVAPDPPLRATFEYRCMQRGQQIRILRCEEEGVQNCLAAPLPGSDGALGVAYVDTGTNDRPLGPIEMDVLAAAAEVIGACAERLAEEHGAFRRRLANAELALLREAQTRVDPSHLPTWPGLQVAAFARCGDERGGDVFDVTRLPNGLAAVTLAHVRGDVIGAAIGICEVRSAFRVASFHADPPHILMREFGVLMRAAQPPRHLDAAAMIINPRSGAAEVCTAGNIGVLAIDERGEPHLWTTLDAPPAGTQEHYEYARRSVRIPEGHSVALFSPGAAAAMDPEGTPLGRNRLIEALCDGFGQPASAAVEELIADLASFFREGRAKDDITVLMLHRPVTDV